ncbi:MAG: hypothetical protein RL021_885 [Bacteroidota bacterium]|jgi:hypothetical protein
MKKTLTLSLLLFLLSQLKAQNLQQLSLFPANPTVNDTVYVVADLMFFSGGCDLEQSTVNVSGNSISVTAKHCPGLLAVICYTTDTIAVAPLSSGTYTLDFTVLSGIFDFNTGGCSNYQSGGQQSLSFTVTGSSNLPVIASQTPSLRFDTQRDVLILSGSLPKADLRIMDLTGRTLFNGKAAPGPLPVPALPSKGMLIYQISAADGTSKSGRVVVE